MNNSHENLLVIVLAALVVIILCSQVAGKIAQRFGQPLAVGEITGGIVLGALLGGLWPQGGAYLHANAGQVLTVMSQLGIVLMMCAFCAASVGRRIARAQPASLF